ncbi:MAG TPA: hypothetical protein VGI33_15620, partial [Paenibacillus sp.]
RSQTNGWALWHHSLSTFFASRTNSIVIGIHFHPLWCSADLALHGWLTGSLVSNPYTQWTRRYNNLC